MSLNRILLQVLARPAANTSPTTSSLYILFRGGPKRHISSSSPAAADGHNHYLSALSSWSSTAERSPYDILSHPRTGPYRKSSYYQLVQIYHPDHISTALRKAQPRTPAGPGVSPEEINRRYRLIVAAHEILSDPARRSAYDASGLGWHSRTELFGSPGRAAYHHHHWQQQQHQQQRRRRHGYAANDDIFRNATWEDWERYRKQRSGTGGGEEGEEEAAVPSSVFGSFLVMSFLLIGVIQAVAIGRYSMHEAKLQEISDVNARFLEERKRNTLLSRTDDSSHLPSPSPSPFSTNVNADEREMFSDDLITEGKGSDGISSTATTTMPLGSSESQVRSFLRSRDPEFRGLRTEEEDTSYTRHRLTSPSPSPPPVRPRRVTHSINDVQSAESAKNAELQSQSQSQSRTREGG